MLALVPGVLIRADVVPGPAIEASLLNVGDVIRWQIVTELVALVNRSPQFPGLRIYGDADRIADAPGIDAQSRAVGVRFQDVGPVVLDRIVVGVVDVGPRADRDVHLLAVEGKRQVSRPMPAAAQPSEAGKIGYDHLRR